MQDVFISHKSDNINIARDLKEFLHHNGISSFIDVDDYSREITVLDKVAVGMKNSRITVSLITKEFLSDLKWVAAEFGMSIIAKNKPIYCICGVDLEDVVKAFPALKGKIFDGIDELKEVFIGYHTKPERKISKTQKEKLSHLLKVINENLEDAFETTVNWRIVFSLFEGFSVFPPPSFSPVGGGIRLLPMPPTRRRK